MAFFLGIDGGGTGCRAAMADADGRIIGQGRGGPANINTDVEGAAVNILAATAEALEGTGADPRDLIATLGLAGGTMAAATERLAGLLPFARMQIVNDAVTAARGRLARATASWPRSAPDRSLPCSAAAICGRSAGAVS
ncbi:BadF/BadG/BcrA/BcrD ATPase family protein [Paracoccus aerius]